MLGVNGPLVLTHGHDVMVSATNSAPTMVLVEQDSEPSSCFSVTNWTSAIGGSFRNFRNHTRPTFPATLTHVATANNGPCYHSSHRRTCVCLHRTRSAGCACRETSLDQGVQDLPLGVCLSPLRRNLDDVERRILKSRRRSRISSRTR